MTVATGPAEGRPSECGGTEKGEGVIVWGLRSQSWLPGCSHRRSGDTGQRPAAREQLALSAVPRAGLAQGLPSGSLDRIQAVAMSCLFLPVLACPCLSLPVPHFTLPCSQPGPSPSGVCCPLEK